MARVLAVIVLVCLAVLPAASGKPPSPRPAPPPQPAGPPAPLGPPGMAAAWTEALGIFAKQLPEAPVPSDAQPVVIGSYVWGGRADQNYRPFQAWIIRIKAGSASLPALRARVVSLAIDQTPAAAQQPWQNLSDLAAGGTADLSYHVNGTIFAAYRVELVWTGGTAAFIAGDKVGLPQTLADLPTRPYVMVVGADAEPAVKTGKNASPTGAVVTFGLWNLGGQEATGVSLRFIFRDAAGKQIFAHDYAPQCGNAAAGTVPAGWNRTARVSVPKVPTYETCSISLNQSTGSATGAANGFIGAKDIEVANLRVETVGKAVLLKGQVRNGSGSAQSNVTLTLNLLDAAGKKLRTLTFKPGDLAVDAVADLSTDIGKAITWASYETSWTAGSKP